MNFTCATLAEARALAVELRAIYRGTDWTVTIARPYFDGDAYRVVVG